MARVARGEHAELVRLPHRSRDLRSSRTSCAGRSTLARRRRRSPRTRNRRSRGAIPPAVPSDEHEPEHDAKVIRFCARTERADLVRPRRPRGRTVSRERARASRPPGEAVTEERGPMREDAYLANALGWALEHGGAMLDSGAIVVRRGRRRGGDARVSRLPDGERDAAGAHPSRGSRRRAAHAVTARAEGRGDLAARPGVAREVGLGVAARGDGARGDAERRPAARRGGAPGVGGGARAACGVGTSGARGAAVRTTEVDDAGPRPAARRRVARGVLGRRGDRERAAPRAGAPRRDARVPRGGGARPAARGVAAGGVVSRAGGARARGARGGLARVARLAGGRVGGRAGSGFVLSVRRPAAVHDEARGRVGDGWALELGGRAGDARVDGSRRRGRARARDRRGAARRAPRAIERRARGPDRARANAGVEPAGPRDGGGWRDGAGGGGRARRRWTGRVEAPAGERVD